MPNDINLVTIVISTDEGSLDDNTVSLPGLQFNIVKGRNVVFIKINVYVKDIFT